MDLLLSIGELHYFVPRDLYTDNGSVRKYTLLSSVGEQILDSLVWECYLIGAIRVVFLHLLAGGITRWNIVLFPFLAQLMS